MKKSKKTTNKSPLNSRRDFIKKVASASFISIVPSSTITSLGYKSPNDMVNIAAVGVGNRGGQVIGNIASPDVVVKRGRMSGFLRQPYGGIQPERNSYNRNQSENKKPFKHANIYAICDVDHDYAGHIINGCGL